MTVKKTTRKRTAAQLGGSKRGQKPYSNKQRTAGLLVLDFFNGNITRASKSLGINKRTFMKWRDSLENEIADETRKAFSNTSEDIVATLKRLIECLCPIVLVKAQDANVRELYYLMGIILDKIENHTKIALVHQAQMQLHAPALPVPEQLPPSIDAEIKKAKWEAIVNQVIAEAEHDGTPVSRSEAVAVVVAARPEAKEYLM